MRKVVIILFCFMMITGCINKKDSKVNKDMVVIINNNRYDVKLEDNDTVNQLLSILPLDLEMNELNGNEKYVYLDNNLVSNSKHINTINAGDIMLFGNNCLVIFYKTFNTNYSYTKIGHIDNLLDLGNDSIRVRIEVK